MTQLLKHYNKTAEEIVYLSKEYLTAESDYFLDIEYQNHLTSGLLVSINEKKENGDRATKRIKLEEESQY